MHTYANFVGATGGAETGWRTAHPVEGESFSGVPAEEGYGPADP